MKTESDNGRPKLMAVLAHPDDESFGLGGTLALYARRGAEVHLICATGGEVGTVTPTLLEGHNSIAELRVEIELRCAAEQLGLAGVHLLGYRDSGMPGSPDNEHPECLVAAPVEAVAARIAHIFREVRPQVVITHDPIGGYKHPDHIAVHRATMRAFQMAGDPDALVNDLPPYQPERLYYAIFPRRLLRWVIRVLPLFGKDPHRWGRNGDIDLVDLAESPDYPVHAIIDYGEVVAVKEAASACHASQLDGGSPRRGLFSWLNRIAGPRDRFTRVHPPAEPSLRETDLFPCQERKNGAAL